MDIELVEKFCKGKGAEIASTLMDTYNSADFELDSVRVEGEIYDIALSYSRVFFFEAKSFLSGEDRMAIKANIQSRFDVKEKSLEKMKDTDLIAHWIKSEVIRALEKRIPFS